MGNNNLQKVFFGLIFWSMSIFIHAEMLEDEVRNLFDKNLILHHEQPFDEECIKGRDFYRLASGGGWDYDLGEYLSVSNDKKKRLFAYGIAEGDTKSRRELLLDDIVWKKVNRLFDTYQYKIFQKEDSIGHVFDAGLYRMEICRDGQPFIYYRYRYTSSDDKNKNRSQSMDLIHKFRALLHNFYEKHKDSAKYFDITEEVRKIEREQEQERKKKYEQEAKKQKLLYESERLWEAATAGAVGGIGYFKDMNANIKNEKGQTPLMVAVKNGYTDVVRALGEAIVNVKETDNEGKTAFDYIKAATTKEEEIYAKRMYGALRVLEVEQIVKSKAKIVQYEYKNDTDTLSITIKGAKCEEFPLPKDIECTYKEKRKTTGSAYSIYKDDIRRGVPPIFAAIQNRLHGELSRLLDEGANVNMKYKGITPLVFAVYQYDDKLVNILLEYGANPNILDRYGLYSPLSEACVTNRISTVKVLLKHGVDVNFQYKKSETALTVAAKGCKNFALVQLLLDNGADPKLIDKFGHNTLNGLRRYCGDDSAYVKMKKFIEENSL